MIDGKTITLVVPCRNEARIIGAFIRRVPACVDEILIIDNNSTDHTARVAKKFGARVVEERRTRGGIGYGYAHMRGIAMAQGDFIVAMDGDDTYPLASIAPIVRMMERERLDMISCNRLPLTNPRAISITRQLGIHILNTMVRLLYGYPIDDILTGMWVVRRDVARSMQLKHGDWNFSPEVKLEAITRRDISFTEYHIRHFAREGEPSKQNIIRTGFSHVWYIFQRRLGQDSIFSDVIETVRLATARLYRYE